MAAAILSHGDISIKFRHPPSLRFTVRVRSGEMRRAMTAPIIETKNLCKRFGPQKTLGDDEPARSKSCLQQFVIVVGNGRTGQMPEGLG